MLIKFRHLKILHQYARFCSNSCSKKDLSHPMQSSPSVSEIEDGWYEWWMSQNFFKREESKDYFTMILPPPNITGKLHMGHALTATVQDALIRWNQMCGRHTVWVPGCDHAGIATQVIVERHLLKTKKLSRHQIGRERFLSEVEKWREEKGSTIYSQLKRMGVALDWKKQIFTMDQLISKSVIEAIVQLYDSGLFYRGNYMINWCSALKSAISDSEVEHRQIDVPTLFSVPGHEYKVEFGRMYSIAYKVENSDDVAVISTTRPETILGDTALMVNPSDERFSHLHGKFVINPLTQSKMPIILDENVDKSLGTGAVKVTPGHDFNDYEVGKRHNLPIIHILDDSGCIAVEHECLTGTPRFVAREWILNHLTKNGQLYSCCAHSMSLPICSRSYDIIEPRIKPQWFISQKEMNRKALEAVRSGQLRLHPESYKKVWEDFLGNEKDWCVSRQLWWGHQIPIYWGSTKTNSIFGDESEIGKSGAFAAASSEKEAREKISHKLAVCPNSINSLTQESDVLDTWFSSSLLPFASFGWPLPRHMQDESSQCEDGFKYENYSKNFYPNSILDTGHDILFFWVARMVMMAQQLTGKLPFKDVLLHSLICDSGGHKMSKSKGNSLDPMDVIDGTKVGKELIKQCGSDSLRFTLCSYDIKQCTISLDMRKFEQDGHMRNKIWQTFRFLNHHVEQIQDGLNCMRFISVDSLHHPMDRWIISELSSLVSDAELGFNDYNFHQVTNSFRKFWHFNLCDVYLEVVKPRLWASSEDLKSAQSALMTLYTCCDIALRVLHPFMPFLTEELYHRLPSVNEKKLSIMQCQYPKVSFWEQFYDEKLRILMKSVFDTSATFRNLRKTYNINSKRQKGKGTLLIENDVIRDHIFSVKSELERISFMENIDIVSNFDDSDLALVAEQVSNGIVAYLHLNEIIDPKIESERFSLKLAKLEKIRIKLEKKVNIRVPKQADLIKMSEIKKEIERIRSLYSIVKRLL